MEASNDDDGHFVEGRGHLEDAGMTID